MRERKRVRESVNSLTLSCRRRRRRRRRRRHNRKAEWRKKVENATKSFFPSLEPRKAEAGCPR